MVDSRIEWTHKTWNPITGCTKCGPACVNCYAERMAKRIQAMGHAKYRNGFRVTCHPECLDEPLRWKKPSLIFPCSMSDLFHGDVSDDFRDRVFDVMEVCTWHTFQLLTKRYAIAESYLKKRYTGKDVPSHVWIGLSAWDSRSSVEAQGVLMRMMVRTRFLSMEPLLGPARVIEPIEWVIIGGESGPNARRMDEAWVRTIVADCERLSIPVFYKQKVVNGKKISMPELDGRTYGERPRFLD